MICWDEANWFAVQTKPYGEKLVAGYLIFIGINTFLPQVKQEQSVCGTERWLVKPLFSGYLFARFIPRQSYDVVRYAPRVLRVLGNESCPLPVRPEIIESIRSRIQDDGFIKLERTEPKCGDRVVLNRGCFAGWMGRVERECDDRKRVVILLESLQQSWLVVEKRFATVATSAA